MTASSPDPLDQFSSYQRFVQAYQQPRPRWDTGITPPELVAAVEGPSAMQSGRALDLGCGTGTNSLYLSRHGWRVTGVDFVSAAIERACEKQRRDTSGPGEARFLLGDVTRLEDLSLEPGYTLLLDLGCLHSIERQARVDYARGLVRLSAPSALFLLYGFLPNEQNNNSLTRDELRELFEPAFTLEQVVESSDRPGLAAAWYWLRRGPETVSI